MTRTDADRHDEFPRVSYDAWRSRVESELKGTTFDRGLVTTTPEGISVQPLYVREHVRVRPSFAIDPPTPPGRWASWQEIRDPSPDDAAKTIAEGLARGIDGIWLSLDGATFRAMDRDAHGAAAYVGRGGVSVSTFSDLETVLAPVDLDKIAVAMKGGAGAYALSEFLWGILDARGGGASNLRGCAGLDPIGVLMRTGSLPGSLEAAFDALTRTARRWEERAPGFRTALVSTHAVHDAGANAVEETAIALATGLTILRRLLTAGFDVPRASAQILFAFPVTSELFMEIAKLRAFRRLWSGLLAASGAASAAEKMWIHATSSARELTRWDPWSNLLRGTIHAFVGRVGGANSTSLSPFDVTLGTSSKDAHRLATNTHGLWVDESHLDVVSDPAAGSWYVESLTDDLASHAWRRLQIIEEGGGIESELASGRLRSELTLQLARRMDDLARRRTRIVGVNEFADVGESPLVRPAVPAALLGRSIAGARLSARTEWQLGPTKPAEIVAFPSLRDAEFYERLRDATWAYRQRAGRGPAACLLALGSSSEHRARSLFAANALASAGIATEERAGPPSVEMAEAVHEASAFDIAVLCGTDTRYAELVPLLAPALKARGARVVLVAGRPGPNESAWRAAGMDHAIYSGGDLLVTLGAVLSQLGIVLPHRPGGEGVT
jgi:methylmalonyl-CoA mutase